MPEEVLFESESTRTRASVAEYLRAVADKLDAGEPITLRADEQSVTLDVPAEPTFEVKAERETSSAGGSAELSLELELEWREGEAGDAESDGSLSIE
ncbi:amphi-Trp domain-containing protein [Halegenticoccus soli]|uniref:amphi-Trp domain-containing protein n=1 Tax=Halegenticoccus soli TaxID=1985678 RepID=UPI000C6DBD82|nr:amphi-Trp domain-containing protein [Halegenticoccus soli]